MVSQESLALPQSVIIMNGEMGGKGAWVGEVRWWCGEAHHVQVKGRWKRGIYIAAVYMKAKKEGCWVRIVSERQVGGRKGLLATCQSRVMIFLHSRLGIGGVGLEHALHSYHHHRIVQLQSQSKDLKITFSLLPSEMKAN